MVTNLAIGPASRLVSRDSLRSHATVDLFVYLGSMPLKYLDDQLRVTLASTSDSGFYHPALILMYIQLDI